MPDIYDKKRASKLLNEESLIDDKLYYMEWFNRYEYEQDKKRYLRKVVNKVLDVVVLVIVVIGFFIFKFSNYIDWWIFKDHSIIKYSLFILIFVVIVISFLVLWIQDLAFWVKNNKKKAMKYFIWIVVSFMTLFAICTLLVKLILSADNSVSV